MTQPDIAYALHVVSQFMHAPRSTHLRAVKRIFCYLQGTLKHGLWVCPSSSPSLVITYLDTDWTGCKNSCRSTTSRYAVFLGPNLIAWSSKKQPTIFKSSNEAEYRAIGYTVAETIWIRKLMCNLSISLLTPVRLYCDNLSATTCLSTLCNMIVASTLRLTTTLFGNVFLMEI